MKLKRYFDTGNAERTHKTAFGISPVPFLDL